MNLKQITMELGNQLVTQHGYDPTANSRLFPNTKPLREFVDWLNSAPEAREVLSEMGVEWPMPVFPNSCRVKDNGPIDGPYPYFN